MANEAELRNPGYLRTGNYYFTTGNDSISTNAPSNNALRLYPWYVPNPITITKIGAEVTTIGEAGSKLRLGIYSDDGAGFPSALVLDAGQLDGASATVQEITLSTPVSLTVGQYWVGGAVQSATTTQPTLRTGSGGSYRPLMGSTSIPSAGALWYGYGQGSVSGALPATFTATPILQAVFPIVRVFVKV